jgi:chromate transporter
MTTAEILAEIAVRFAALSLVAIGGINAILPEIHRVVVDVEGWMTSAEFAELFALAQLAPGPNAMVVALVGWKVAGGVGALVATLAACGPSSVACYIAWQWADRLRQSKLRVVVQRALAPLAIGLIMASGYTLALGADRSPGAFALTALATGALAFTRVNPVWILLAAAVAGVAGLA